MTPSASKYGLLLVCPWWARREVQPPAMPTSPAAAAGTAFHSAVETGTDDGSDLYRAWRASDWSRVPWQHEVAYAYDGTTARVVGKGRASYPADARFPGTADLVLVEPGLVTVADIKTGYQAQHDATPAADVAQLRGLAVLAALAHGVERARIVILDVTAAGVDADDAYLDGLDLLVEQERLDQLLAAIPTSKPQPGRHCTEPFPCPAVGVCPATERALSTVPTALVTADTAGAVVLALRQAEARIEALWSQVRALAAATGRVELPDGAAYRRTTVEVEKIDAEGPRGLDAQRILTEHGLGGVVTLRVSATWEDVEETFKAAGLKGRGLAKEREAKVEAVREALRAAGALTVRSHDEWRVVGAPKPRAKRLAAVPAPVEVAQPPAVELANGHTIALGGEERLRAPAPVVEVLPREGKAPDFATVAKWAKQLDQCATPAEVQAFAERWKATGYASPRLADPAKEKWHDNERALLAAIEAEQAKGGGQSQEPPPHTDEDIPF